MGKDERKMMQIAKRQNMPLPARIRDAPELEDGLDLYADGFQALTTSRTVGQGCIGAIPYAAISYYCHEEGIVGEMREDFFYHIERLDAAYIEWQTERAKRTGS